MTLVSGSGLDSAYIAARTCKTKKSCDELYDESVKMILDANMTEVKIEKWLWDKIVSTGHWSILEFIDFTFHVEGITRACATQLRTHRIASHSQLSHRYVNMEEFEFDNPFVDDELCSNEYLDAIEVIENCYKSLIDRGTNREDARSILPESCLTNVVFKMNARELVLTSQRRMCCHAQDEIRVLFENIKEMFAESLDGSMNLVSKLMGPMCYTGRCFQPCKNQWQPLDFEKEYK